MPIDQMRAGQALRPFIKPSSQEIFTVNVCRALSPASHSQLSVPTGSIAVAPSDTVYILAKLPHVVRADFLTTGQKLFVMTDVGTVTANYSSGSASTTLAGGLITQDYDTSTVTYASLPSFIAPSALVGPNLSGSSFGAVASNNTLSVVSSSPGIARYGIFAGPLSSAIQNLIVYGIVFVVTQAGASATYGGFSSITVFSGYTKLQ
jgi:hypothetical protein